MLVPDSPEIQLPRPPKHRLFRVVCWFFIILAFLEIVSLAITINYRLAKIESTKIYIDASLPVEEPMPEDDLPQSSAPLVIRSVEEILQMSDAGDTQEPSPQGEALPDELAPLPDIPNFGDGGQLVKQEDEENISPLDKLIREARAAQIEGDMRKTMLKLEEAKAQSPNHPAMLYYFGLTYEMLGNAVESRSYYAKVYEMRAYAGPYFKYASRKLEAGFSRPQDMRGKMSFGTIQVYRDPDTTKGERVVVTIPVQMAHDISIRPEDLYIPVQFFDKINDKDIALTRSEAPAIRWLEDPVDWVEGEELLEVTYHMPLLSSEEIIALGDVRYYGYTAKLYYKGEPMDCVATPNALILIEQRRKAKGSVYDDSGDSSLLPPIEAEPVSDSLDFLPP